MAKRINMKKYRVIQLLTGFHAIHHIIYSDGIKIPFIDYGYFKGHGLRKLGKTKAFNGNDVKAYHNCTLNGY